MSPPPNSMAVSTQGNIPGNQSVTTSKDSWPDVFHALCLRPANTTFLLDQPIRVSLVWGSAIVLHVTVSPPGGEGCCCEEPGLLLVVNGPKLQCSLLPTFSLGESSSLHTVTVTRPVLSCTSFFSSTCSVSAQRKHDSNGTDVTKPNPKSILAESNSSAHQTLPWGPEGHFTNKEPNSRAWTPALHSGCERLRVCFCLFYIICY